MCVTSQVAMGTKPCISRARDAAGPGCCRGGLWRPLPRPGARHLRAGDDRELAVRGRSASAGSIGYKATGPAGTGGREARHAASHTRTRHAHRLAHPQGSGQAPGPGAIASGAGHAGPRRRRIRSSGRKGHITFRMRSLTGPPSALPGPGTSPAAAGVSWRRGETDVITIRQGIITGVPASAGRTEGRQLTAARLHDLALKLAVHHDLRVSVITYQDGEAVLEVLHVGPPRCTADTIDREVFARPGHAAPCGVLSVSDEAGLRDAVDLIRGTLLKAAAPW